MLVEKLEYILSTIESSIAVGAVGKDANPDGGETGNRLRVPIVSLLLPPESNKVDRGVLDVFEVEELGRLQRDISLGDC